MTEDEFAIKEMEFRKAVRQFVAACKEMDIDESSRVEDIWYDEVEN